VRILAVLVLLVVVGCGDTGPTAEEQVRSTVTEFSRATAAKDYDALCDDILAPDLIEEAESIGLPCELALRQALGELKNPQLTIGRVEVRDDRATARVQTAATGQDPSEDTLQLVRVNGRWRIASLDG
jgi:hypothetical protein